MVNQRYIIIVLLTTAIIVAMSAQGLLIPVLAKNEISDPMVLGGFRASTIGAFFLGTSIFFLLNRNDFIVSYSDEVISELRKVTWPDKEETYSTTFVVIALTLFVAFMLGFYDFVWAEVTQIFLFRES
jgi:preprotein translocase subunit SecE